MTQRDQKPFTFSPREIRGAWWLILLNLGILFFPAWMESCSKEDLSDWDVAFQDVPPAHAQRQGLSGASPHGQEERTYGGDKGVRDSLFYFDPNRCSYEDWIRLGVSSRRAGSLRRYVEAGGVFSEAKALLRFRGWAPGEAERLMPFVRVSDPPAHADRKGIPAAGRSGRERLAPLDINAADSAAWERLPGIGPVLAARIVAYRGKLGGFYDKSQLLEVWGLKDSVFQRIESGLIQPKVWNKLALNRVTREELARHPYFGYRLAGPLVAYREKRGPFTSLQDLLQIPWVGEELLRKVGPYVTLE